MRPDFIPHEHSEKPDFVFIDEVVTGIRWDAKYATCDNFTGKPVGGYEANRIVGTPALCSALEKARTAAATEGFGLLLWDGYRPQRAVDRFLRWSQEPEDGRTKARHYPNIDRTEIFPRGYAAARSAHSRGSTIDLTIYHLDTGELADMGGGHDLMDVIFRHDAPGIGQSQPVTDSGSARSWRTQPSPVQRGMVALHPEERALPGTRTSTSPSSAHCSDRLGHGFITTAAGGRVTDEVPWPKTRITTQAFTSQEGSPTPTGTTFVDTTSEIRVVVP